MLLEIQEKREVFFELVELLKKERIMKDDIISMGNLALFVDYAFPRYKWQEKKKQIERFAKLGDKNEVNMLLAGHLYEIAMKLEISDNLNFKLEKMSTAYEENKLKYFDMVLDPYDFPEWFKWVMEYHNPLSPEDVLRKLSGRLESHPTLLTKDNEFAFSYFVDRFYPDSDYLKKVTEIDLQLRSLDSNELSWYIAKQVFRFYYPEMQANPSEQAYALHRLNGYKNSYEHGTLRKFHLFSADGEKAVELRTLEDAEFDK